MKFSAYVKNEKLFDFEAKDARAALRKAKRIHGAITHINGQSQASLKPKGKS